MEVVFNTVMKRIKVESASVEFILGNLFRLYAEELTKGRVITKIIDSFMLRKRIDSTCGNLYHRKVYLALTPSFGS